MAELLIRQRFHATDVTGAAAALQAVFGVAAVTDGGGGALEYRQQSAVDDGISVTRIVSSGARLEVRTDAAPDLVVVVVREGTAEVRQEVGDVVLESEGIGVVCLGSTVELRWESVTADLFSFPPATVARLLGSEERSLRLRCARVAPRSPVIAELWRRTAGVLATSVLQHRELFESDIIREQAIDALLAVSVEAFGIADVSEDDAPDATAFPRASAVMQEHLAEPITIPDIARTLGMSVRKLQLEFRRAGQGTPSLHLRQLRMRAAREALTRTGPARPSSVAAVARSLSYTNLGRFSAHYREAFGETPVETLRGTRDAVPGRGAGLGSG